MRYCFIALLLVACANDNYVVLPNEGGSKDKMSSDLYDCKIVAIHQHQEETYAPGETLLLGGAAVAYENIAHKQTSVNPAIEACMLKKGYSGTSSN